MASGNTVKIGVIVIALCIAGAILIFAGEEDQPKSMTGATHHELICIECGEHSSMPNEEWELAYSAAPVRTKNTGTRMSLSLPKLLKCPKCGAEGCLEAKKCETSETWYAVLNADGTKGSCPE